MREAILALPAAKSRRSDLLSHDVSRGVDLPGLVDELKRHYIDEALRHTESNKTQAAKLLGLNSHQTLTNWCVFRPIVTGHFGIVTARFGPT